MKYSRKSGRNRHPKNTAITKSGKVIKINRSIGERLRSNKFSRQARRATFLSTLPKDRLRRLIYRFHPKRLMEYWFSREGGIMVLKIVGISIVIGFFLTIGLFAFFRKDLPKIKDLSGNIGGSITYYDRTGKTVLWQDYNAVKRVPVASDQISTYVKQATVAIEDKGFYHEGAFDLRSILRAALHNIFGGGNSLQGGSTITQQLVKLNNDWVDNRTITRKLKELILSVELERQYSKDDILTGYLNRAPYGSVDSGIETAALDYFHVNAKDLTLPEAALLASIPKSPSYYSPYSSTLFNPASSNTFNKAALIGRQQYALDQMAKQHFITQAQADAAKKVDILSFVQPIENKYNNVKAPYFVLAAKKQLEQKYSSAVVNHGGWKIITTLDLSIQTKAEQLVASNLANVKRYGGDQEAMIVEAVTTGQINALVGGVDFNQPDYGQLNYADQVLIPPGSSFKPYDYTSLINTPSLNAGAGSVLYDSQGPIIDPATGVGYPCTDKSSPTNTNSSANCLWDYDRHYPGPLTLRYAIGGSRNVPAVKAFVEAGVNKTISLASSMMDNTYLQSLHQNTYNCYNPGTDLGSATAQDITQCYASAGIGDGAFLHLDDHINGLATLARLGSAIPRTFILQINDSNNNTIYKWTQPKGDQVISADTAYIMNNMLSDPNASYFSAGTKFQHTNGWNFAVKTGTTNNNFDGLMTSWSTQFAVVSWVGHHTRNRALTTAMENVTMPLTRNMMLYLHTGLKPVNWVQPSTVKTSTAFVVSNHVGYGSVEPSPSTDLFPGWYTVKGANTQVTDKVSGLIATTCTPDNARSSAGSSNTSAFSIDWFINGTVQKTNPSDITATDNVHLCGDVKPTITLTPPGPSAGPYVCNASDNAGLGCSITITATQGTHLFTDPQYPNYPGTITISLDGKVLYSYTITADDTSPVSKTFNYIPTTSGTGKLTSSISDSVLYLSSSDTYDLTLTAANAIKIAYPLSDTPSGSPITISWTGGSGDYYVSLDGSPVSSCQKQAGFTCPNIVITGGSHTVTVTDSNGGTSGPFTFKK